MKNHLSMLGSIGAGAWFSPEGTLSWEGSVRSCEWATEVLALRLHQWVYMSTEEVTLQSDVTLGGLARDEALPSLSTLADDVHGVFLVLALAGESELVLGLAVGDLVDAEPLVRGPQKAREVALDILDVVQFGSKWVVDVDDDDLPVSFLLVKQSHDTEDLDLDDFSRLGHELTNLAHIQWIVVTLCLGLRVDGIGVLPGLQIPLVHTPISELVWSLPAGRRRSSTGSPCAGNSCERNAACPS